MTINVDSVPDVTQVAVTSTPTSGTTPKKYGAGEKIRITATFDEDVTVTGSPVVNVEVGSNSRPAAYVSGTGTAALVFEYTVVAGDSDTDGIEIAANALGLNSGTIKDSDSHDADITHTALATQSDHQVDGTLTPPTAPTVVSAVVAAAAPKELVLTFDQDLDTAHEPATGAFAFKIDGGSSLDLASVKFDSTDATKLKIGIPALTAADMNVTVAYTKPVSEDARLQNANGDEVEDFTVTVTNSTVACPSGQPSDAFWEACLTVGRSGNDFGLTDTEGSLSPVSFTHDSTTYTIDRIFRSSSGLSLSFDKALPGVSGFWSFQIGSSDTYRLGARDSYTASTFTYVWSSPGFTWDADNVGDKVSVSLTLEHRPFASDSTVDTDEDTTYVFQASDFPYTYTGGDFPLEGVFIESLPTNGQLKLDGTVISSVGQWITKAQLDAGDLTYEPPDDANGTGYAMFDFIVRVNGQLGGKLVGDAFTDATMTINVDSVPDVTQVAVTSTPTSGTTPKKYGAGEKIQVTATFDEDVTVTGDPVINVEVGSNSRPAAYVSGSSTATELVFEYTVVAADTDSDGISINANALTLDSDDKIEGSDNDTADITHAALAAQSGHQVDGTLTPPTAPTVVSAVVAAADPKELVLTFDQDLDTDHEPGTGVFAFKIDGGSSLDLASVEIDRTDATKLKIGIPALTAADMNVTVAYTKPVSENARLQNANGDEVEDFTVEVTNSTVACPSGQPSDAFWEACLTVGQSGNDFGLTDNTQGSLSPVSFTHDSTTYTIDRIFRSSSGLSLSFDKALPGVSGFWSFQIGSSDTYRLGARDSYTASTFTYVWSSPGFTWDADNVGDKVSVSLRLIPNAAPTASNRVVMTNEDTAYTFAAENFNFTDTDTDDTLASVKIVTVETAGDLELSGTDVAADDVIPVADITAGNLVFTPAANGNGAPYATFTFTVNDGRADSESSYTMTIDVTPVPEVTQVVVTSTPGAAADTYGGGEVIQVTVTFDEAVTVDETGGTPFFRLRMGNGGGTIRDRDATYVSGSGTTALVFGYTVVAADSDDNGIWIESNALMLNGGTIQSTANDSIAAILDHAQLGGQSDHKVNGSLDSNAAPTSTGGSVTIDEDDNAFTFAAENFNFSDGDNDPLHSVKIVTLPANGKLQEGILVLSAGDSVAAANIGNLGFIPDPNWNGETSFTFRVNDGTVDSLDATMTITVIPAPDVLAITNDETSGVRVTSTPRTFDDGGGKVYGATEEIQVTVTFDQAVIVIDSNDREVTDTDTDIDTRILPQFELRIGSEGQRANYVSGSGTTALVFEYTVQSEDRDSNGISIPRSAVKAIEGSMIQSAANSPRRTNANIGRFSRTPGTQSAHKVNGSLTPDETAPTVSSAVVAETAPKTLAITFDEPLATGSVPDASAFTVKVDGTDEPEPAAVEISGAVVNLTLATALDDSQTNVTVDYTNPGTDNSPLKDPATMRWRASPIGRWTTKPPPARRGNPAMPSGRPV